MTQCETCKMIALERLEWEGRVKTDGVNDEMRISRTAGIQFRAVANEPDDDE